MSSTEPPSATPPASELRAESGAVPAPASGSRRHLVRWIGRIGMVLSLGFLAREMAKHIGEFPALELTPRALGRLALALLATFVNLLAGVVNWKLLLGRERKVSLSRLAIVFGYTQVAKYLPGNVFQYVFGVVIGRRVGIPASVMIATLSAEMMVAIATAIGFGSLGLISEGGQAILERSATHVVRALHSPILLALFALVALLGVVVTLVWPRPAKLLLETLRAVPAKALPFAAALIVAQFVLNGFAIREVALIWAPQVAAKLPSLFLLSSGFAVAWVVGSLVPGAPGGVGIREAILLTLFAPVLGEPLSLATFFAMRLLTIFTELIVFAPAPFALRRLAREDEASLPAA
jgi:hypothetical protein